HVTSAVRRSGAAAVRPRQDVPGRRFTGSLARTSNAIDVASRTLLTEIDVDNSRNELLPGSYAEVHIKLPSAAATLELPVDALIFKGDGLQVATVDTRNRIALVAVTSGRDFGEMVEVLSGLNGDERVVSNPPDSLTEGQTVRIVTAAASSAPAGQKGGGAGRPRCSRSSPPAPARRSGTTRRRRRRSRRRSRSSRTGRCRSRATPTSAAPGGSSSAIRRSPRSSRASTSRTRR